MSDENQDALLNPTDPVDPVEGIELDTTHDEQLVEGDQQELEPPQPAPVPVAPDTGNALIDMALEILAEATKATDEDFLRAFGKAIERNDLSLLDTVFIAEKFGVHAAKVESIAKELVQSNQRQQAHNLSLVHSTAGSQANWDLARKVFNDHAPEDVKEVVRTLFNASSDSAIKAASQQVLDFAKSKGLVLQQRSSARPDTRAPTAGLSAQAFQEAVRALDKEFGNKVGSPAYTAKYEALFAARRAGKAANL